MAFGNQTFASAGGAVQSLMSSQATADGLRIKAEGDRAEAGNYHLAAELARQNEEFTVQSTEIKQMQAERSIAMGIGTQQADIATAGFQNSGSALDLLRSSAQQGALTHQVVGQQGLITEASFHEQRESYLSMEAASQRAADSQEELADNAVRNGYISAGVQGATAIATLFV